MVIGRWLPLIAILSLFGELCACNAPSKTKADVRAKTPETSIELTAEFLKRAHSALLERVGSQAQLLEMRAQGRQLSFVVQSGGKFKQIDYVEHSALSGASAFSGTSGSTGPSSSAAKSAAGETTRTTQVGKIYGPELVDTLGEGPVPENLFPLAEVQLHGIVSSFPVALSAVDPDYGRVTGLVVRRFLPFSTGIRARIYVDSPKMSGSIDTNERGIPLKKR
jgi:hypothetical protein